MAGAGGLTGRTAIVTGGGTGIGAAVAARLASRGARVMVVGRSLATLEGTCSRISAAGGDAVAHAADVSDEAAVRDIVQAAMERWSAIDILVNCAGVLDESAFLDLDAEAFRRTLDVNVVGTFLMTQAVARVMVDAASGAIVHISSVDALASDGPTTAYPASKAAVASLARTMAVHLAPWGIRVNCVAPGWIDTEMTRSSASQAEYDAMRGSFARVPLRRLISADEVASAVAYLVSDEASGITGSTLVVDGGLTADLFVLDSLDP